MSTTITRKQLEEARLHRRTFAIISHPDAGKTTLTEKLLLFGGSIEVAGAVRGRKSQRSARSDWMELEKQRGISVSSTVLTFAFEDTHINLLDTPGHHDFSEDTYRTLMAADCAVMVIDAAKGIESQTEKLFRVCAARGIPVITFVNKIDRPGPSSLEILGQIEKEFSIEAVPINWPVGNGPEFSGIVDIASNQMHLFSTDSSDFRAAAVQRSWPEVLESNDSLEPTKPSPHRNSLVQSLKSEVLLRAAEELELVKHAGQEYERERFLGGQQTLVFFGSALANFGMELFLRGFIDLCPPPSASPPPKPTEASEGARDLPQFSGFVFKIQANLDPMHRDRVAFIRVRTGRFERDMDVTIARSGNRVRLPRALKVFGRERLTMEEAFPGDIIGVVCPGELRLGDSVYEDTPVRYPGVPQFPPEVFASIDCPDTSRRKQFDRGLEQLVEEGAVQLFYGTGRQRDAILAAVGELQFDVVQFRLESEYKAPSRLHRLPYAHARWYHCNDRQVAMKSPYGAKLVNDSFGSPAILIQSDWDLKQLERNNPDFTFDAIHETRSSVEEISTLESMPK
ncbi:peptide chain release factor 3 [Neorhodopirellula pilleata]|uniref:Peptide chain release factor 3 n=1 Tax=Neorhodopirellula pilleata TaxID=2714738 RepID=A0A5C6AAX7_9BACT|nr:peptide chain release factor 3 [Neorhodopirellula pilleata]TWT96576.1 Peptide chain release factor 3 [Neorhodopirellula pilleata]